MMESEVYEFAEKYFDEYKVRHGQLIVRTCPFCHGGQNNDAWTFGIGLQNGLYQCFRGSCSEKGSLSKLKYKYGDDKMDFIPTKKLMSTKQKYYDVPDVNDLYPVTDKAIEYFARRKISEETVNEFKISCDSNGNIVFPFYRDNKLTFVKYRKPQKHNKGDGPKEWQMPNTKHILFNMDNINFNKPVYITEGEIDCMSLYEAGIYNVVSVPSGCNNFDWIENCWEWLEKCNSFVLFGDQDDPGIEMTNNLAKRLGEDRCMIMPDYPQLIVNGVDAGRICKDANEILYAYGAEALHSVADDCEPAPIKGIINLADVKYVDPSTVERIYTRIPELDEVIGGFRKGQVIVVSGKRGRGKSTVSGTWLMNAMASGSRVCAYSGELDKSQFFDWIVSQATESKYATVKTNPITGKKYAVIPQEIHERIRDYVDGKFFLYDNEQVDEERPEDAVIKAFTATARRYGCDFFLVDNLMSITCGNDENETKQQTRFMSRLKAFANKYNATVIIVAHARKTPAGQAGLTNNDISGSSAISNLADTVLGIDIGSITVMKNREFGTTATIITDYDPCNRRIFSHKFGDRIVYKWNHEGINIPEVQACMDPDFAIQSGEDANNPF